MSDVLEQALWPFPAKSWAHVLDAVREHPCDAAQIRSRLAAGGVLDDTITTLQVQNVAWKLRGGFPEWFSEPPAPAPPQALVEVLHPLPLHALGHYLRAALQHPSEPDRVRACLLDGGVVDASVTALALHNVQAKVRAAFPGWLPEEPSAARNLPVACTLCLCCGSALQPHALLPCFILTYGQGQRPLQVEQRLCLACDRVFAACWSWPRGHVARARLEARPGPDLLLVLCPQRASVAAVDAVLFRFLSASLVHVRSSFRGFADLLRDFHTIPAGEHLHDSLLHGWLVYYAVAFLADAHWSELRDVVFCFGRHDRSLQLETLDVLGELLQTAFLRRYSSEHSCMRCTAVPTLAFDGKVNRAVPVCAHRQASPHASRRCSLGLRLPVWSGPWILRLCRSSQFDFCSCYIAALFPWPSTTPRPHRTCGPGYVHSVLCRLRGRRHCVEMQPRLCLDRLPRMCDSCLSRATIDCPAVGSTAIRHDFVRHAGPDGWIDCLQ